MNTPNKLTVLRVVLAPVFLALLLFTGIPHSYFFAAVVFVAAAVTDALDGNIARKYNLITDFGKFLDPLADKMLVVAALLGFIQLGLCDAWVAMIIITREFLVTSLRLVAAGGGKVIAASAWGKVKTVSQMAAIITVMLLQELKLFISKDYYEFIHISGSLLIWISAILTVISGVHYIYVHRDYINTRK